MAKACQSVVDEGKARVQVNKITLIAMKKEYATAQLYLNSLYFWIWAQLSRFFDSESQ